MKNKNKTKEFEIRGCVEVPLELDFDDFLEYIHQFY